MFARELSAARIKWSHGGILRCVYHHIVRTDKQCLALAVCWKTARHNEDIRDSVLYHKSAEAGMRGAFVDQGGLFSYIAPEARVPANHPLRKIRKLVRDVLGELNRSSGKLYESEGRP
jgi:hypothetical protein